MRHTQMKFIEDPSGQDMNAFSILELLFRTIEMQLSEFSIIPTMQQLRNSDR